MSGMLSGLRNFFVRILLKHFYRPLSYKTFDLAFREEIEDWRPDLVHAHDIIALPTCAAVAKQLGIPMIFDSHELEEHRNPPRSRFDRWLVRRLQRRHLPQCATVTTVSGAIADYLQDNYAIARPILIYNSPSLAHHPVNPRWNDVDRFSLRLDAGLVGKRRGFVLVYVGNVTVNRGIEVVLRALCDLPPDICLVTVGRANQATVAACTALTRQLGIEDRVRMLQPVAPNHVVRYIAEADAAIIPLVPATLSYEFAMPNKLFEAAFAGLPVVASDTLEIGRFVRANVIGLLFDPFNPRDCARKILEIYHDPGRYKPDPRKIEALQQAYAWERQEEKLGRIVAKALACSEQAAR